MPSASAWGSLREGRGGWPFVLGWATCGVGLNSSGDLDPDSSCWELVLQGEVRLVVGLSDS